MPYYVEKFPLRAVIQLSADPLFSSFVVVLSGMDGIPIKALS
jgi:hypothetical protein